MKDKEKLEDKKLKLNLWRKIKEFEQRKNNILEEDMNFSSKRVLYTYIEVIKELEEILND